MIDLLRPLVDKIDSMQEQMGNVSNEMAILRKNQTEMLWSKALERKWRMPLMGLFVTWTQLGNIFELEDMKIEISQTEKQKHWEKQQNTTPYPRTIGQTNE